MRQFTLVALAMILMPFMYDATAQQVVKKRIGTYIENGNVVLSEAVTTLAVDVCVEREQVIVGPYARYAQKYFGQRASLVDKSVCRIADVDVAIIEDVNYVAQPLAAVEVETSDLSAGSTFATVLPNRLSATEKQPEQAAEQAASIIFELRNARLELITGEYGDGVYGAGLESALREIDRMEQSLLELFYGKRIITRSTTRYEITVEAEKTSYVVARFNADEGLLATDNLAGEIVLLAIQPSDMTYPAGDEKGKIEYRYANNARVSVSIAQQKYAERVLPIYEFGKSVKYAPVK